MILEKNADPFFLNLNLESHLCHIRRCVSRTTKIKNEDTFSFKVNDLYLCRFPFTDSLEITRI